MKTAVQIGAGNIGRGFMAQIFRDSGYHIIFIDVNQDIVNTINELGQYQIELVSNQSCEIKLIDQICAVSGRNLEEAAAAIAQADVMAISVGVIALEKIAPMVIAGLRLRWQTNNQNPLNILVCENLLDAPGVLRRILYQNLSSAEQKTFEQTIGLIGTSMGGWFRGIIPAPIRICYP